MRYVSQESFLVRQQGLYSLSHRVEIARQRADLVFATVQRTADASVERARRQRARGFLDA
jgi:hypothetical protein